MRPDAGRSAIAAPPEEGARNQPCRDLVSVVRALFDARYERWPDGAFDCLAEDAVLQTAEGHTYMGHQGFTLWYLNRLKSCEACGFEDLRFERLTRRWVLVEGVASERRRTGEDLRQPGCWLVRVNEERVSACLYFRTAGDALAAID